MLRSLKEDAEAFLGEPVTEAVITVPAYFNDQQRKATHRAGELAGLHGRAADQRADRRRARLRHPESRARGAFLVFDLGGGTFDVSIVEMFEGIIEVRASTGDNRLGGEDFNEAADRHDARPARRRPGRPIERDDALYQKLREQAERARRDLSGAGAATMRVIWQDAAPTRCEIDDRRASRPRRRR